MQNFETKCLVNLLEHKTDRDYDGMSTGPEDKWPLLIDHKKVARK